MAENTDDVDRSIHVSTVPGDWVQSDAVAGLQIRNLWEREDGASFALLRFAKGAGITVRHRHASNQFMYCLSGKYRYIGGPTLTAGDFYMNPMGQEHGPTEAIEESVLLEVYDGPHYFD